MFAFSLNKIVGKIQLFIVYPYIVKSDAFKIILLDTMIDKHIGKRGAKRRDAFENELRIDLLGQAIKQVRQERNLTQEQLGELVGVQKAQSSNLKD